MFIAASASRQMNTNKRRNSPKRTCRPINEPNWPISGFTLQGARFLCLCDFLRTRWVFQIQIRQPRPSLPTNENLGPTAPLLTNGNLRPPWVRHFFFAKVLRFGVFTPLHNLSNFNFNHVLGCNFLKTAQPRRQSPGRKHTALHACWGAWCPRAHLHTNRLWFRDIHCGAHPVSLCCRRHARGRPGPGAARLHQ